MTGGRCRLSLSFPRTATLTAAAYDTSARPRRPDARVMCAYRGWRQLLAHLTLVVRGIGIGALGLAGEDLHVGHTDGLGGHLAQLVLLDLA